MNITMETVPMPNRKKLQLAMLSGVEDSPSPQQIHVQLNLLRIVH